MAIDYQAKTAEMYKAMEQITDRNQQIQLRNKIIELNIKLVSQVLKEYRPYSEDNYQNGCVGLIMAADTFQLGRGVPFASYACFCIRRAIQLAYKKYRNSIESQVDQEKWVNLDEEVTLGNGDTVKNSDLIWDEQAQSELDQFIHENELSFICSTIIRPCIEEISNKGKHMPTKVDIALWEKLEFAYIMDLIFIESQKQRFNLSQLAKQASISIQNVRIRHERVMEIIFQRMWEYMALPYAELLVRLRGSNTIPQKLLCIDPGKTTGWCLFENGHLTVVDHVKDCYDDKNVDVKPLLQLIEDIKPDYIVYEDYKIYATKLDSHTFNPVFTLRLIGAIEAHAQMNDIKTHKQMAATAKNFVTDDKLKQWGFYERGLSHGRDAIRHGCYFLLFYKRGQNIV